MTGAPKPPAVTGWLAGCLIALLLASCVEEPETRPGLPVHCLDEPDPGPCEGQEVRWYYDYRTDSCKPFHYGGCQGRVPFEDSESCRADCVAGEPGRGDE